MFHGNLEEVRDAIASLGNNLHEIQLSANADATEIPVEFQTCSEVHDPPLIQVDMILILTLDIQCRNRGIYARSC